MTATPAAIAPAAGAGFGEFPAAGLVRRRRSLPNGRAVMGGLLVVVALVGVFAAWLRTGGSTGQPYVVARHALSPGVQLRADDLALATMSLPAATSPHAFRDLAALVGRVVAAPVGGGELVEASAVLGPEQSFAPRQVPLTVDVTEAAGLQPGQPVDVLVTHGNGDAARTDLVVAGAEVLRVTRADPSALSDRASAVVIVGVRGFTEVQALVHALRTGQVDVVAGSALDRALIISPGGPGPAAAPGGATLPAR